MNKFYDSDKLQTISNENKIFVIIKENDSSAILKENNTEVFYMYDKVSHELIRLTNNLT